MVFDKLKDLDIRLFLFLNNLGSDKYDAFWVAVTQVYFWIPLYIYLVFLIVRFYDKKSVGRIFWYAIFLLVFTLLLTESTKNLVGRLRPNNSDLEKVIRSLQTPANFSFFSGHAANSFAMTTYFVSVLFRKSRWVLLFYLWPVLFSYSRIYVGVHYPLDIFVGAVTGTFLGAIAYKMLKLKTFK